MNRNSAWIRVPKAAASSFLRNKRTDAAAALTYYAVFVSAPAALALVSVLGLVGNPETTADKVLKTVDEIVPDDVSEVLQPLIQQVTGNTKAGLALLIGIVLAFWSASGYVGAFSRAQNQIYGVPEGRPVWILRPVLLAVTVVAVVLAAIIAAILVLSGPVAAAIGDAIGLDREAVTIWNIVKWPVAVALMMILVAVLYQVTPNVRLPRFRLISWGSMTAIVLWAVASAAFGWYVSSGFSSYGSTYGALAGVIVLLLWLWITNLALLFGAELDAEIERQRELEKGLPAEENLQLSLRDNRASDKSQAKRTTEIEQNRRLREAGKSPAGTEDDSSKR